MTNLQTSGSFNRKEDPTMRNILLASVFSIFLLASCSSTYDASAPYDDVYASGKNTSVKTEKVTVSSKPVESSTAYEGDYYSPDYADSTTSYNEEFDSGDYYDYEYSSRLKRFHGSNPGFDYYDSYYTNNYYYDNCYCGGSSIYGGWGPSISFGLGWGWGSMYYGWGYPYYYPWYWGYPYYGWGYPYYGWGYGSYWNGYWNGYWDGYYGGGYYPGYPPYYNDWYGYGSYYGPRGSRSGNSNGSNAAGMATRGLRTGDDGNNLKNASYTRGSMTDTQVPATAAISTTGLNSDVAGKTARSYKADGIHTNTASKGDGLNPGTAEKEPQIQQSSKTINPDNGNKTAGKITGDESATRKVGTATKEPVYSKPAEKVANSLQSDQVAKSTDNTYLSTSRRVQPEMKYDKPKNYTSPEYRTTPSNQEYRSPAARDVNANSSTRESSTTRKIYTTTPERKAYNYNNSRSSQERKEGYRPSYNQSRSYTTPSGNSRNTYSAPSNSGRNSYSAPSKGNYSAPSRSYSSPSSSGTRPSSGGGARGGRR